MLKRLEIQVKLDNARAAADAHKGKGAAFETRSAALNARREALNKRIDAATEETSDDERLAVENETAALAADNEAYRTELADYNAEQERLDAAVTEFEKELADVDAKAQRGAAKNTTKFNKTNEREDITNMRRKNRSIFLDAETRNRFFENENVKNWVENARALAKRGVSGGEVTIITEVVEVLRPAIELRSKLLKHVNLQQISGDARQPVLGVAPEAVWTEACGKINELDFSFAEVDMGNYKVAGFVPICNALLEDSYINLGEEILANLAASIARAVDKAIIYGTGVKMPLGIVTRLAQAADPNDANNSVEWEDLRSSNIKTIANTYTGKDIFQQLTLASGEADDTYAEGDLVHVMSKKTWTWLKAQAVAFDAAGALRAELDRVMPIVGGIIEIDNDIPYKNIIMGYFEDYTMGQRRDMALDKSEHVKFIDDQTVFRGKARYDGRPSIAKAFVLVGVDGTLPTTSAAFRPDYANTKMNTLTVTAAAGSAAGKTVLTVSGTKAESNPILKYQIGAAAPGVGTVPSGEWTSLTSGSTAIEAAAGTVITVVELDANGLVVSLGDVRSVPKAS